MIVPSKKQICYNKKQSKAFDTDKFYYDAENSRTICPEGHALAYRAYAKKIGILLV